MDEDVEVLGKRDQAAEEEGDDGAPHSKGRDVGHLVIGDALGLAGADEEDVGCEQ